MQFNVFDEFLEATFYCPLMRKFQFSNQWLSACKALVRPVTVQIMWHTQKGSEGLQHLGIMIIKIQSWRTLRLVHGIRKLFKVVCISWVAQLWDDGRLDFTAQYGLPIQSFEPLVFSNVVGATAQISCKNIGIRFAPVLWDHT